VLSATAKSLEDGRFEINADILSRKYRDEVDGSETPLPFDEVLDIAVYAPGVDAAYRSEPIYLQAHIFAADTVSIQFVVDEEPGRIAIDPHLLRIEQNRMDNRREVEIEGDR
jgi:hypothetical protein